MSTTPEKCCFVTVGATASFTALIQDVLASAFLATLRTNGFTNLVIQYGKDGADLYAKCLDEIHYEETKDSLQITGFTLDTSGLLKHMIRARGTAGHEGVVISHAGSGTVLDALRVSAPLIVVPNTDLLDNHQVELAEALAEQGYVVHGSVGSLGEALVSAQALHHNDRSWPIRHQVGTQSLKQVLKDEMGFLD